MSRTESTMVPLGLTMPNFALVDSKSGKIVSDQDFADAKAYVVMFICNHCPYVKHVNPQLVKLANDYRDKNVSFVGISSNDAIRFPDDSFEKMKTTAEKYGYPFPYLYDESQEIAKAFDAACTPDLFVYKSDRKLVYRGQLDDSRPSNELPVNGKDLRKALDCVLGDKPVDEFQRPSIGCNIKWKL